MIFPTIFIHGQLDFKYWLLKLGSFQSCFQMHHIRRASLIGSIRDGFFVSCNLVGFLFLLGPSRLFGGAGIFSGFPLLFCLLFLFHWFSRALVYILYTLLIRFLIYIFLVCLSKKKKKDSDGCSLGKNLGHYGLDMCLKSMEECVGSYSKQAKEGSFCGYSCQCLITLLRMVCKSKGLKEKLFPVRIYFVVGSFKLNPDDCALGNLSRGLEW